MDKQTCFKLGKVLKKHSFHGEVVIFLDNPDNYKEIESVFLEYQGGLIPFFIQSYRVKSNNTALVMFDDVKLEHLDRFVGSDIWLSLEHMNTEVEEEIPYSQLEGFTVVDQELGDIGLVEDFIEGSAQNLLCVRYNDNEVLIPAVPEIILKVNNKKKSILVAVPDGLIDLYL